MKRFLCKTLPNENNPVELDSEERKHAHNVLRLKQDAWVEVLNGAGEAVTAQIHYEDKKTFLVYQPGASKSTLAPKDEVLPIVIEAAVLKGAAYEWLVEKATELGVKEIVPLKTKRTVVQWNQKTQEKLIQRWQKIADQSLKQCGRLNRLLLENPKNLSNLLKSDNGDSKAHRFFCDELSAGSNVPHLSDALRSIKNPSSIHLLIGPEGGFELEESQEIQDQSDISLTRVSLGPTVMRAETAAIYASSLISGFFRSSVH